VYGLLEIIQFFVMCSVYVYVCRCVHVMCGVCVWCVCTCACNVWCVCICVVCGPTALTVSVIEVLHSSMLKGSTRQYHAFVHGEGTAAAR